ncbi:MAG: NAD(P)/FAD-dependent oxidoreductase [Candidatus Altiarchaeota archaeon]
MKYDAAVVGAGPVGCIAATHAAKSMDVALIGGDVCRVQCAGLISKSGLERLGVSDGDFILNRIRGARFYSPGGVLFEADGGKTMACVVDRIGFDGHLLNKAVDAGAVRATGRVVDVNGTISTSDGSKIKADRIALATGTDYSLHITMGIEKPSEFLIGMQYEMDVECDNDFAELYFTVPDFFAWVIPIGDRARIGLCTKRNPRPYMEAFVKKLRDEGRLRKDTVFDEHYGIIPIHKPSMRTQYDGLVTVGDAGGQVKASTGGGIVMGGLAAEYAFSDQYEREWKRAVGRELLMHLFIHRFLSGLSPKSLDRLFDLLQSVRGSLESGGDMDYASRVISSLAFNPRFAVKFLAYSPFFIADML